jgi:hypothetical protein
MQFVSKAPVAMGTCLACACNVIRLLRWTRSLIDVQTLCADCRFSRSTIPLAKRGSGARLAELGMEAPPTLRYVSIDLECGTLTARLDAPVQGGGRREQMRDLSAA